MGGAAREGGVCDGSKALRWREGSAMARGLCDACGSAMREACVLEGSAVARALYVRRREGSVSKTRGLCVRRREGSVSKTRGLCVRRREGSVCEDARALCAKTRGL